MKKLSLCLGLLLFSQTSATRPVSFQARNTMATIHSTARVGELIQILEAVAPSRARPDELALLQASPQRQAPDECLDCLRSLDEAAVAYDGE